MKRLLLSLLLFQLGGFALVYAQIDWGLKFGMASSHLHEQTATSFEFPAKTGFIFGTVLRKSAYEKLFFQLEALYMDKGARLLGDIDTETLTTNNLSVSFSARPHVQAGPFRLFLGIGPYLAFALSGRFDQTLDGKFQRVDFAPGEQFQRWDGGWIVEGGLEWDMKLGTYQIALRHDHGLSEILKKGVIWSPRLRAGAYRYWSISFTFLSN